MSDEELDRLARVAFDAFWAEGTPYTEIERAMFRSVVQAVIDAMPATGTRLRSSDRVASTGVMLS